MLSTKSRLPLSPAVEDLVQKREAWKHGGSATMFLAYAALGVIYGDIATSPLYAMAGIFSTFAPTPQDILGAVSLIFWSITLIVLLKYVCIVLRANDHGEGGTFALYTRLCRVLGITTIKSMNKTDHEDALKTAAVAGRLHLSRASRASHSRAGALPRTSTTKCTSQLEATAEEGAAAAAPKTGLIHKWAIPAAPIQRFFQGSVGARAALLATSVLATSMLIGDGVLTPAISVVSAVQGLTVKTHISQSGITGISIAILTVLFLSQSFGTHRIAFLFSPIIILFMLSILGVGLYNLGISGGDVLRALNPQHIVTYFADNGVRGWESLGGVMLCLTGCEAMFADLGHFSVGAVAIGFPFFVYPCIIVAYLGQGAHLLVKPEDVGSAFWANVPDPVMWPMLVISTCAAVVASQAMISGAFSIVRQAIASGCFPALRVVHTGGEVEGQVYIGSLNYVLMLLCIAVVAGFGGDGTKIGNAYGIAVTFVMTITTLLVVLVMVVDMELSALLVLPFAGLYLLLDVGLLSANLVKVPEGGWFTLLVSFAFASIMLIWMSGQQAKGRALEDAKLATPMSDLLLPLAAAGKPASTFPIPPATNDLVFTAAAAARDQPPQSADTATSLVAAEPPGQDRLSAQGSKPLRVRSMGLLGSLATRSRRLGTDLQPMRACSSAVFRGPLTSQHSVTEGLPPPSPNVRSMPGSGLLPPPPEPPAVCLAKLRGFGIYFTPSRHGIPPVMWHLLRNVEAVHEVVVLLTNQVLPIPYLSSLPGLDVSHRFGGCTPVVGIPHMYRVVARYGYMDSVDNGAEFAAGVKEYIKGEVRDKALEMAEAAVPGSQATSELQLLDSAFEQGVVYYLGRTRLKMKKLSNAMLQVVHDAWYGDLYRYLYMNAWDKIETWNVPSSSLVELSIGLEI